MKIVRMYAQQPRRFRVIAFRFVDGLQDDLFERLRNFETSTGWWWETMDRLLLR